MKRSNRWLWSVMILVSMMLLAAGCSNQSSDGVGIEPGTPAVMTLSANNTVVAIDNMITIRAAVTDSNGRDVADGTVVSLTCSETTITITPSSQLTVEGIATFIVTGLEASVVNLIAQSSAAIATITISVVDTAPSIELSADDTTLTVGDSTTISATVREINGDLVSDGTDVSFSLSNGSIGDLGAIAAVSMSEQTVDGVATVKFTAEDAGTVTITATYGAATEMITITVSEQGGGGSTPITPTSLILSTSRSVVPPGQTATITAIVRGSENQPVNDGTAVSFSTDSGKISPASSSTSGGTGRATATFTAGAGFGTATITATAGSATDTVSITVAVSVSYLSIATSKTSVKTDNRDSATITATALDQNRAAINGSTINFSASAGQISAAEVTTNASGQASVVFTSGSFDKANQVVTITADAAMGPAASIPIQLTGTEVVLTIANTSLQGAPIPSSTTLTVTVQDGAGIGIFGADVAITQASEGSTSVRLKESGAAGTGTAALTGTTDVSGKFYVTVSGNNPGAEPVTLTAASMGYTATKDVTVSGLPFELLSKSDTKAGPGSVFAFNDLDPDTITRTTGSFVTDGFAVGSVILVSGSAANDDIYDVAGVTATTLTLAGTAALTTEAAGAAVVTITELVSDESVITAKTSDTVNLWVRSPEGHKVRISTSMETLTDPSVPVTSNVIEVTPTSSGIAEFILNTPVTPGVATLQAEDLIDLSINDSLKVAVSAPSSDAAKISIQATPTIIAVSSGDLFNLSTLHIVVTNISDGVVGGVPVVLTLERPTGGGEYISPSLIYTDSFGQAEATLYSGSLVSDSQGVLCVATIVDTAIEDDIAVVIGGNASSVSIGSPTEIEAISESVYRKPMSVMVADSNGNPVVGATVNLSVWPLYFADGCYDEVAPYPPIYCAWYDNEDDTSAIPSHKRNEVLDSDEDISLNPVANGNGVLDPPKSSAGTVPATVVTDENGVAEFDFFQQKVYSVWTVVEIKASVMVYGSETMAILEYGPVWLQDEAKKQVLPESPWGCSCLCPPP